MSNKAKKPIGCASFFWAGVFLFAVIIFFNGADSYETEPSTERPSINSFGIKQGMHVNSVAIQLEGKVSGISYVSKTRNHNVLTGNLDGSSENVRTHSIYYSVPGTSSKLRIYFWNDKVKTIEWD
jgi:hypothetical protein